MAYMPVGAWGENVIVGSWLDSLNHMLNKPISFSLKLCGVQGPTNATHYGNLELLGMLFFVCFLQTFYNCYI